MRAWASRRAVPSSLLLAAAAAAGVRGGWEGCSERGWGEAKLREPRARWGSLPLPLLLPVSCSPSSSEGGSCAGALAHQVSPAASRSSHCCWPSVARAQCSSARKASLLLVLLLLLPSPSPSAGASKLRPTATASAAAAAASSLPARGLPERLTPWSPSQARLVRVSLAVTAASAALARHRHCSLTLALTAMPCAKPASVEAAMQAGKAAAATAAAAARAAEGSASVGVSASPKLSATAAPRPSTRSSALPAAVVLTLHSRRRPASVGREA